MGNSKVIFGNETLIDLTGDTVTPDTLLAGTTAHNRSGNQIVGTMTVPDTLDDLTDVDITTPTDGQVLTYDSASQKWVNANGGGGGGGFVLADWLTAGGLNPMSYADLAAVLADEKAVRKLMTIHLAVDYLAGQTAVDESINTILTDNTCAKWINLRDYALDTLDYHFHNAMKSIGKYFYGEWAFMPQVPKMTSNTAPYGTASAISEYTGEGAWKAFDGSDSSLWSVQSGDSNLWLRYAFVDPVKVTRAYVKFRSSVVSAVSYKFQAYNGSSWVDVSDTQTALEGYVDFSTIGDYSQYQLLILSQTASNVTKGQVLILQFYAWAPKGNVPIMTSNTAPYGTASAYQVFDGNSATTASGTDFSYQFVNPICPKSFECKDTGGNAITGGTLQGSNDGSTWETPQSGKYYLYLRVHFASSTTVATVQFYGRELKVSVPAMTSNTAPYGEASSDRMGTSGEAPWKAFDKVNASWIDAWQFNGTSPAWIVYDFKYPVVVKSFDLTNRVDSINSYAIKNFTVDGFINDSWETIGSFTNSNSTSGGFTHFVLDNNKAYEKYRLSISTIYGANGAIGELNFYGENYSEYDWDADHPRHYLYDHGVEPNGVNTLTNSNESATGTKEISSVYLHKNGAQCSSHIISQQINAANYNLARVAVGNRLHSSSTAYPVMSIIANSTWVYSGSAIAEKQINLSTSLPYGPSLDLSNINQNCYAMVAATSNGSIDMEIDFNEWWLE